MPAGSETGRGRQPELCATRLNAAGSWNSGASVKYMPQISEGHGSWGAPTPNSLALPTFLVCPRAQRRIWRSERTFRQRNAGAGSWRPSRCTLKC